MREILEKMLAECGLHYDGGVLGQFCRFWEMVEITNEVMNLTAVTEKNEAAEKHFVDSLFGAELIAPYHRVLDLGSGAGFPGIPLAIVLPNTKFVLLDSLNKRVGFLNSVISELCLRNVTAIHARAEDAARTKLRASFDAVTARAVAPLCTLAEYALPFATEDGRFFAYKGQDYLAEEEHAKTALASLGGKIFENHKFSLNNGSFRVIIEILKMGKTPDKYPRGQNKPKTSPIASD